MNRDSEEYSPVPRFTSDNPDEVIQHLTGRDQATPDLVGTLGVTDARTPGPGHGKGPRIGTITNIEVLDCFVEKLLHIAQSAPRNSRGRAWLMDAVAALTWVRVRGSTEQTWQIDDGQAEGLIKDLLREANVHSSNYVLVAELSKISSDLAKFISMSLTKRVWK